jgi:AcrR family transcriptional regulator
VTKGFTQEKSEIIRERLLIKGKELFVKYGYKKFGIRDLTAAVGIGNGMFYKFFDSKEELFFLLLDDEKKKIRDKIDQGMRMHQEEPIKALKNFYYIIVQELNDNPMMKTIFLKQEYPFITTQMTQEQMIEERNKSLQPLLELTAYWKEKGLVKHVDLELIISSLRSLVLLWFHKEEIGEDQYPKVIEFMIDKICADLE